MLRYSGSSSNPMNAFAPHCAAATALAPIPRKGSITTALFFPWSLIQLTTSSTGNVAG